MNRYSPKIMKKLPKASAKNVFDVKLEKKKINRGARNGKGVGRPESITEEKASLLISAIENALTLEQAYIHAEVSEASYRRKLIADKQFRLKIEAAKQKLKMLAKAGMANKIKQEDGPMIRWYLEKAESENFGRHFGDDDFALGFGNITLILPGRKPHPRIVHDEDE